jgi:hypothetical protein
MAGFEGRQERNREFVCFDATDSRLRRCHNYGIAFLVGVADFRQHRPVALHHKLNQHFLVPRLRCEVDRLRFRILGARKLESIRLLQNIRYVHLVGLRGGHFKTVDPLVRADHEPRSAPQQPQTSLPPLFSRSLGNRVRRVGPAPWRTRTLSGYQQSH